MLTRKTKNIYLIFGLLAISCVLTTYADDEQHIVAEGSVTESHDRGELEWMEIRDEHYEFDEWRWQYPSWAYDQVKGTEIEKNYDLDGSKHLFMLHGDFDGDGLVDVAAWVQSRSESSDIGVVVVHQSGGIHFFNTGGPNWEVISRDKGVEQGVEEGPHPKLQGDALLFVKPEASSSLYYWDGSKYVNYRQGD